MSDPSVQSQHQVAIDYTYALFRQLQADVAALSDRNTIAPVAKLSYATSGLAKSTYAELPTGSAGALVWVTDGRKPGEGAAAGTGCPAYFDNSVAQVWKSLLTNTAVTI